MGATIDAATEAAGAYAPAGDGGAETSAALSRPMRADARRNYERLVAAARKALSERGSDASMEEIAKSADVGVGTLYRHFPRRIDLVEAVYRDDVDALVIKADELADHPEAWDALVAWLDAFIHYAQTKRVFLNELHEAFEKNPDLASNSRERIGAAAGKVLGRAQLEGSARADIDQSDLMQLVSGMCMARQATLEQNERLLKIVLDGVRSPS
ncbi:TetR/AcrR family transcriptional regulator [Jatrophihabitans sp. DSM 45814]